MKIPKTFVPEKNLEKSLEKILSKKLYTIDEEKSKILVHDINGKLIDSKTIGENISDLETFDFYNNKMFTVKFGDNLYNRAVFNKRLEPMIMTPSYPNQAYSVFERKNHPSILMVNTTAKRTKGTKISYYKANGTKLDDDMYHELHDILTNKTFVIKTNEQNYLALCFSYYTILVHEDLKNMMTMHTTRDVNDIHTVNLKGEERIIALCFNEHLSYQVLRIFDKRLNLLEELSTKDFKHGLPIHDSWHDQLLSFKPYRIGSKDYFLATVERKKEKDRIDLKVLNQDFEEVFQLEDIVKDHVRVEKFNGKDRFFVPLNQKVGIVNHIYDENFCLQELMMLRDSSLREKYKVVEFNGISYFACVHKGYLNFYSDDILCIYTFDGFFGNNQPSASIRLADTNSGLKKIIPFDYKGKDFLALEYWHNECTNIYDSSFKLVKSFPGGDFCVA